MSILAGEKLTADKLNTLETALVARHRRTTSSTTTTATTVGTSQGVCRLDDIAVKSGRLYRVTVKGGIFSTNTGRVRSLITYTTDGSTPTGSNAILKDIAIGTLATSVVVPYENIGFFTPGSDLAFSVLLSVYIVTGAGTSGTYADAGWPTELLIEDCGTDTGSVGTNI
ncbi:hypothetical protein GCM10027258_62260 [Amycolatopsis stemonae]